MILYIFGLIIGFVILVWSADKFVEGAASTAKHLGMPTLLIGILVVGFGTSAPEMVVSAIAALEGNPELALGNAIGSNIVNIALILGVTAIIAPIAVNSNIIKKELPLLFAVMFLSGFFLYDYKLTMIEGVILLALFFGVIAFSIYSGLKNRGTNDSLEAETEDEFQDATLSLKASIIWLIVGLILLVASSRLLVWSAVGIATEFGVSDLIIGLTIIALGTSLPELAASIVAVKKNEHDLAVGNVVGSNMFNILAVIGISATIAPMSNIEEAVLHRDWIIMLVLTIALLFMAYGFKGRSGRINRVEGALLVLVYIAYNSYLGYTLTLANV